MNRRHAARAAVITLALVSSACSQRIEVGSDLLWTARFESGSLDEWTGVSGGGVFATTSSNQPAAATEHAHRGLVAAKTSITTSAEPVSVLSTLVREGGLPDEGYYSAWFYLPQGASILEGPIVQYWAIMRFRARTVASDPNSARDLFDIDLRSLSSGKMFLRVFDYDLFADASMVESEPLVPVGRWFQVEVFYRNASDASGHITVWLDGRLVADLAKPTEASGWVGWRVGSMGLDIGQKTFTVYVDDCALSRVRVGPTGLLAM